MEERLQKLLSRCGIASRRQAEAMIAAGRVQVNGQVAALGASADLERDEILLDGKPLAAPPEHIYLMLHKPRGYVTTLSDEKGRRNVSELVADCDCRVYPERRRIGPSPDAPQRRRDQAIPRHGDGLPRRREAAAPGAH